MYDKISNLYCQTPTNPWYLYMPKFYVTVNSLSRAVNKLQTLISPRTTQVQFGKPQCSIILYGVRTLKPSSCIKHFNLRSIKNPAIISHEALTKVNGPDMDSRFPFNPSLIRDLFTLKSRTFINVQTHTKSTTTHFLQMFLARPGYPLDPIGLAIGRCSIVSCKF